MNRLRVAPLAALVLVLTAATLLSGALPASGQTPPILDDFNRPDEDPLSGGGNWAQTTPGGLWPSPMRISNNVATRGANTSASYWTPLSFAGGEGSVWARSGGLELQSAHGVHVALLRDVGGSGIDGYEFRRVSSGPGAERFDWLHLITDGARVATLFDSGAYGPGTNEPWFNLRRVGNTVQGWTSPNGSSWTQRFSVTDTTHTTGTYRASIHANATADGHWVDDFGAAVSGPPPPTSTTLTVIKNVINNNGGTAVPANWTMNVAGPTPDSFPGAGSPGTTRTVQPGTYTISESGPSGYALSYSGQCNSAGSVTLAAGESKTCTLTNDDQAAPPSGSLPPQQTFGSGEGGMRTHGKCACGSFADPVNTRTGAFTTEVLDLETPGTGVPFSWNRNYTSADPTVGRLGPGWTDSYSASLAVQGNGDVLLHGEDGQQLYYTKQGSAYVGAPGSLSTLTSVAGGYELKRTDQVVYSFNAQGRLLSMKDRHNQGVTLGYDGQGRLATITDAAAKQVTLAYNASNLVSAVSTQDGRNVSYGYTAGRLTSVTDVRGKPWTYAYDAGGRLESITDPLSHRQILNVYNAGGRVTSQTDAVNKVTTFDWDATNEIATAIDANQKQWKHDYDDGELTKEIDPLLNTTQLGYDGDLNTDAVISPTSQQTTMTYDAAGNLLSATAPPSLGNAQKSFVYNARNDPTQMTDARNKVTSYTYTPSGDVQTVTQDAIQVGGYTYDSAGRVLTFLDGNEKTTTYTYFPASGYLESITDPLGNKTTYTYDPAGRIATRIDPKGNVQGCGCASQFTWTYTYNAAGQQLTEVNPLGHTTTNVYDDAGRLTSTTDANTHTTSYTYDNANRVLTESAPDPDGGGPLTSPVTTYTYDDVGNKLTETDPRGHITTFAYNGANRLVSETGPDPDAAGPLAAPLTTHTYDPNGNVASTVEPRGNAQGANPDDFRTTYTHDAAGRILVETQPDPDGAGSALAPRTTNVYDLVGNLQSVTDRNNHQTSYTHDAAGRILTVTAPDLGITTYGYDDVGNVTTREDAKQHVTTYAYDGASRLLSETSPDPDGPGPDGPAVTTYTYDPNGNRLTLTDPNATASLGGGGVTTYGYDRANRLTSIDYSDNTPDVTYTYDNVGNRLTMTDGGGSETRAYDNLDRLRTVTRAADTFDYQYDPASNLTRRTYPGGAFADYNYDRLNRMTSVASGGQTTSYGYDVASNLTQTTLPAANGYSEARVYDRAGRLTEVATTRASAVSGSQARIPEASIQQTQFTGPVTNIDEDPDAPDGLWMTASGAAPSVRVSFPTPSYKLTGQQSFKAQVRRQSGGSGTRSARIDLYESGTLRATGTTQTITSTSGQTITQSFDASVIVDKSGAGVEARLVGATTGGNKSIDLGALRWTQASYLLSPQTLARFQYTLDPVGNPTQVVRTGAIAQTQSYAYDASDRLIKNCLTAAPCTGTPEWTYDKVGNRLSEGGDTYSYDARDRLLAASGISYGYDANGNLIAATQGTRTANYEYDLANRLTSILTTDSCPACRGPQLPAIDASYLYDGDGKRVQANDPGATRYLWDVSYSVPQLALERTDQGALIRRYLYGHSRIAQTSGSGSVYFHPDNLGSTSALTSQAGAHETSFTYEAFGSVRGENQNASTPPTSVIRFTGEQLDATGLYHLRARQYDPSVGRFLRRDPAEQAPSGSVVTSYGYAASRPTAMVDPSGETFVASGFGQSRALYAASAGPPPVNPADWRYGKWNQGPVDLDLFRHLFRVHGGKSQQVGRWLTPELYADARSYRNVLDLGDWNSADKISKIHGSRPTVEARYGYSTGGAFQIELLEPLEPRYYSKPTRLTWGWWARLGLRLRFPPPSVGRK